MLAKSLWEMAGLPKQLRSPCGPGTGLDSECARLQPALTLRFNGLEPNQSQISVGDNVALLFPHIAALT